MNKKIEKRLQKIIIYNRKASYNYNLGEYFESGIVLQGWEVKSIREGKADIKDSYVSFKNDEAFLLNSHISPLSSSCAYLKNDPKRVRKLLLKKREILKIEKWVQSASCSVIPIDFHWVGRNIKVKISLSSGKKLYDKRESIKARDIYIESKRLLK